MVRLTRALGALVGLLALTPGIAEAQELELCQAEWLDPERLRAVLSIELRDGAPETSFVVSDCDGDAVRVHAAAPGAEPAALELSLADLAPSARTRFVALVLAELVRSGPAAQPAPEPTAEVVPDEPAEAAAGEAPPVPLIAVVVAPPEERATPLVERLEAPAVEAEPRPSVRRWSIAASAGYRSFAGAQSGGAIGEGALQLRFDRLLVEGRVGGAVPGTGTGTARVIQATAGGGIRILDIGGHARFRLDAVAEIGFSHIRGQPNFFSGAIGVSAYAFVFAATARPTFVLRFDPVEIAIEGQVGYQRGPVLEDGFTFASFDGLLVGANLGIGLRL